MLAEGATGTLTSSPWRRPKCRCLVRRAIEDLHTPFIAVNYQAKRLTRIIGAAVGMPQGDRPDQREPPLAPIARDGDRPQVPPRETSIRVARVVGCDGFGDSPTDLRQHGTH